MIESLIFTCQSLSPELMSLLALALSLTCLLILLRIFGAMGVTLYIIVAVITSNIQVLKIVKYDWMPDPVAYGTIVFATTFIAMDILTEFYGKETAKRATHLGFAAMALMTLLMLTTLGTQPVPAESLAASYRDLAENHNHMMALFSPQPSLLIAGAVAYYISQFLDITIFSQLSKLTHKRLLWLRTHVSSMAATIVDNTIFSILAWMVLAPTPLPWSVVLPTYILSTLVMRLIIATLCTPAMYVAKRMLPKGVTSGVRPVSF